MLGFLAPKPPVADAYRGFAVYGGTPDQIRYSSLRQINRTNVQQLQLAWTYDSGETGGLQTQPVVADGVLYAYTPTHKTFALNAATGRLLWTFDSGTKGTGPNRGVVLWGSGNERRVFAAVDRYVYALDARTGTVIPSFGKDGRIDLQEGLGRPPDEQSVRLTTPGIVYRDLMILGGRVSEDLPATPGDIRAYDVRTGALRWSFHTIPHPGEAGYETWPKDAWTYSGAANNWAGFALDERRGIVFASTGSPAADFYGANRVGDNLYANCVIALDAATGKRLWHFQIVKHDIWDRDPPAPPNLVTVRRNGRLVDAVAQTTKQGYVFVFDRETGTPLFPIEYRKFPASTVPGEVTADTQPIPTAPKPFARQLLTSDMLTTRTPEAARWAQEQFRTFRSAGQFVPLSLDAQTVIFPGFDGGAEWGGQAFDPETSLYYVNSNDLAWTGGLAPSEAGQSGRSLYQRSCAACHRDDRLGTPPAIPSLVGLGERKTPEKITRLIREGAGRMPGFPNLDPAAVDAITAFLLTGQETPIAAPAAAAGVTLPYHFTGYRKFLDPEGYPAIAPPWGTLSAINLSTGAYAWQVPFGEYPELVAQGLTNTGSENYGGPVVSAGGLVFIGASNHDRKLRAYDKLTGELLWEVLLPFSGNATPAVYEVDGRQFVAIAAGGGKSTHGSGGAYVAFALPVPASRNPHK